MKEPLGKNKIKMKMSRAGTPKSPLQPQFDFTETNPRINNFDSVSNKSQNTKPQTPSSNYFFGPRNNHKNVPPKLTQNLMTTLSPNLISSSRGKTTQHA